MPAAQKASRPVPGATPPAAHPAPRHTVDDGPAAWPALSGGSASNEDSFEEPLVLVGNPRLGSRPRAFADIDEALADSMLDGGEVNGLIVRGASLRGDDHRYYSETRQDSFSIRTSTGAAPLLVCVADGVGSQPLSHLGSTAACRLLADELAPRAAAMLDPKQENRLVQHCQDAVDRLAQRIEVLAQERDVSPKALSTTLVAVLFGEAEAEADSKRRVVLFGVGDSSAFILRGGAFQSSIGPEEVGELAGDATDALPTHVGQIQVRVADLVPGDLVLVCTDGLANPMRNDRVRGQLAQWWQRDQPPGLAEFYWQLSFRAQSFGDDRTAVCVWIR